MSPATAPRRLILTMSASLDGFLAREDNEIEWLAEPGEVAEAAGAARHQANLELLRGTGLIVLGRRSSASAAPASPTPSPAIA
jgi:hypothetical protein